MPSISELIQYKTASTKHSVNELIKKRWSARAFSERAIEREHLNVLLEAASWSASSMNLQPWQYWFAEKSNAASFQKFYDCLMPGNQIWCKNAAVILLCLAEKDMPNGQPNRYALHDAGAANTTLLLQAADLDIYGHMLGGYDHAKALELLNIPDHLEPVCFIALGYLGDVDQLEEPFKTRETAPRSRKPVEEFSREF
jgi:nitroreductase